MNRRLVAQAFFMALLAAAGCQVGLGGDQNGGTEVDAGEGGIDSGSGGDIIILDGGGWVDGGGDAGPFLCASDDDCLALSSQADFPYCNAATGRCVQCRGDADCMTGYGCSGGFCDYGPTCRAEGGLCRFGDYVYPCLPNEIDVTSDCPGGALCCVPNGESDGGTSDGGPAGCGDGFCRELVFSSCGRPDYEAVRGWSCVTGGGVEGYCCEPIAIDGGTVDGGDPCYDKGGYCNPNDMPCNPGFTATYLGCDSFGVCCLPTATDGGGYDQCETIGGYCTLDAPCKEGYQLTQVGCGGSGIPGSCCIPVGTDGGVTDGGGAECRPGDTREYLCPDYSSVPWCTCTGGDCAPVCDKIGSKSEGWYGSCDGGGLVKWDLCGTCSAECLHTGTKDEGWYSSCTGGVISLGACGGFWNCIRSPENGCTFPCIDNCNCHPDRPVCDQKGWGKCVPRSANSCTGTDTSFCACGDVCLNGQCTPAPLTCKTSCDCPTGGAYPVVCVNGACVQKKEQDCNTLPCPCGTVCTNVGPTTKCVAGCNDNCDCPSDLPFCAKDPNGQSGKCAPGGVIKCGPNGEGCPCGFLCMYDKCIEAAQQCTDNCDCRDSANPICHNGVCGEGTAGQFDCPCGMVCAL